MHLREFLKTRKMTADQFGGWIGVSKHAVGKWARGESIPRSASMQKIFKATAGAVRSEDFYASRERAA